MTDSLTPSPLPPDLPPPAIRHTGRRPATAAEAETQGKGAARAEAYLGRPVRGWGWWLMAASLWLLTLLTGIAVGSRQTERRYADVPNPKNLEQRVTQLEKQERIAHELAVMHNGEIDDLQKIIGETKEGQP